MKQMKRKLKSRAGESLAETLVSLLVAVVALVMLASAMTSAANQVNRSRTLLDAYYEANESEAGVVKQTSGKAVEKGVTVTVTDNGDNETAIGDQSWDVSSFENAVFSGKPVISYQKEG